MHQRQLRFFTPDRQLVYTPEEAAAQAETSLAQAQTSLAETEALLVFYREQFGALPEGQETWIELRNLLKIKLLF